MRITGRLKADKYHEFLLALISDLSSRKNDFTVPSQIGSIASQYSLETFINENDLNEKVVKAMVDDIIKEKENALFYAGDQQSEEIHILVNIINEILGSNVHYKAGMIENGGALLADYQSFRKLVDDLNSGKVDAVIHVDSNPVYHLPKELGYARSSKKASLCHFYHHGRK